MLRLLILSLAFLAAPASAQSIVGSWDEAATGLTYEFRADGTGQIVQGANTQPFAYALQDGALYVQQNGGTLAFTVEELGPSRATFALPNGTRFTLARAGSASGARGDIEGDVQLAVNLLQFVVGEAIAPREVDGIRREIRQDYAEDPDGTAQSLGLFRTVLTAAAQATDPIAVCMARQQLLVGLLDMRRQTPDEDSPFFDAITSRVRLVAYDPATQTGATDRDVRAALDFLAWQAQASGGSLPTRYAEYEAYVAQHFGSLSRDEKEFLSAAAVIWSLAQAQWATLSASQRTQAQHQIAGASAPDLSVLQQQAQHDAAYYQTLSEISAMQHQTSMGILNNMGGATQELWQTDAYGNPTYQVY
jgi:hypothetical protein